MRMLHTQSLQVLQSTEWALGDLPLCVWPAGRDSSAVCDSRTHQEHPQFSMALETVPDTSCCKTAMDHWSFSFALTSS